MVVVYKSRGVATGPVGGHAPSARGRGSRVVVFSRRAEEPGGTPAVAAADMALVRRFEPILRFTEGELFLPASVDEYVQCCQLLERGPDRIATVIAPKGSLTIEQLVELGADRPRPGQYLRFVDEPFTRVQVAKWAGRSDRPRFHNAGRLSRVGGLSRGLDRSPGKEGSHIINAKALQGFA